MGEIGEVKKPGKSGQVDAITVGEFGHNYLQLNLDHTDKSVAIEQLEDDAGGAGWLWLDAEDGAQSIDDLIAALETAKQLLRSSKPVVAQDTKTTQADYTAATGEELRRRASEGDEVALVELNRRRVDAQAWMAAA